MVTQQPILWSAEARPVKDEDALLLWQRAKRKRLVCPEFGDVVYFRVPRPVPATEGVRTGRMGGVVEYLRSDIDGGLVFQVSDDALPGYKIWVDQCLFCKTAEG
jgi:hypothetical protein